MKISLIVAMTDDRVIGRAQGLPWYIPEDLRYFKLQTLGKPVVMGHLTYLSIGRPLPDRTNIVLTRDTSLVIPGVTCINSVAELAQLGILEEIMVIGGGEIYKEFLPLASRLYITYVSGADIEGDTYFPEVLNADWSEIYKSPTQVSSDEEALSFYHSVKIRNDK